MRMSLRILAGVLAGIMIAGCSGEELLGDPDSTPTAAHRCTAVADTAFGTGDAGEFCVVWQDAFEDETGFRVTLNYGNGAEVFVYESGPNSTSFFPPRADSPPGDDVDLDTCLARSNRQVFVDAVLPDGTVAVTGGAMNTECRGFPGTASPTP